MLFIITPSQILCDSLLALQYIPVSIVVDGMDRRATGSAFELSGSIEVLTSMGPP